MVLLKDLKSILFISEIVTVYDETDRFEGVVTFYGKVKDIPQKLDNCIVYNIFINANEELSICIKNNKKTLDK